MNCAPTEAGETMKRTLLLVILGMVIYLAIWGFARWVNTPTDQVAPTCAEIKEGAGLR